LWGLLQWRLGLHGLPWSHHLRWLAHLDVLLLLLLLGGGGLRLSLLLPLHGLGLLHLLRLHSDVEGQLLQPLLERARVIIRLEGWGTPVQTLLQPLGHLGELLEPLLRGIWLALLEELDDPRDHLAAVVNVRFGLPPTVEALHGAVSLLRRPWQSSRLRGRRVARRRSRSRLARLRRSNPRRPQRSRLRHLRRRGLLEDDSRRTGRARGRGVPRRRRTGLARYRPLARVRRRGWMVRHRRRRWNRGHALRGRRGWGTRRSRRRASMHDVLGWPWRWSSRLTRSRRRSRRWCPPIVGKYRGGGGRRLGSSRHRARRRLGRPIGRHGVRHRGRRWRQSHLRRRRGRRVGMGGPTRGRRGCGGLHVMRYFLSSKDFLLTNRRSKGGCC